MGIKEFIFQQEGQFYVSFSLRPDELAIIS
jgi:hypothetical protein